MESGQNDLFDSQFFSRNVNFGVSTNCRKNERSEITYFTLSMADFGLEQLRILVKNEKVLPRVRIELTTLRLWDSRAAYCAIEADEEQGESNTINIGGKEF